MHSHLSCNCMKLFFSDAKDKLNYCLVIKNFNNEFLYDCKNSQPANYTLTALISGRLITNPITMF